MISINAIERESSCYLIMQGHADYNPGNDIVCAGCSAIWYAYLGWIANNKAHVEDSHELHCDEGNLCYVRACGDESLHATFTMALIGLAQIAAKYPDCVEITAPDAIS